MAEEMDQNLSHLLIGSVKQPKVINSNLLKITSMKLNNIINHWEEELGEKLDTKKVAQISTVV